MRFTVNRYSFFVLLLFSVVIIFLNIKNPPKNILTYDVFGYYLYLPGTFIYHELEYSDFTTLNQINEKYKVSETLYQIVRAPNGKSLDKYSMGMALLYLPFFLIAHLIAIMTGIPADGFSPPYNYTLLAAGLIYAIIGIFVVRKILLKYFSDGVSAITLILLIFGTNFLFKAAFKGISPHVILFTVYACIIWFTIKWHEQPKIKYAWALGISCGLAILARPSEIVCLAIPLLWGVTGWSSFRMKLKMLMKNYQHLVVIALSIFLIWLPQLIYWKVITGKILYYSYDNPGEGFEFLRPYTWQVLFSFRKGWLIYTPMMIFSLTGFYYLYLKNRAIFLPILIFFILNLYIVSAWTCWWYSESFGQRALLQSYAVLAIPFGYFTSHVIHASSRWLKITIILLSLSFFALNSFQIWQLRHGILDASRMTRAYYFATFGRTMVTEGQKDLLIVERPSTSREYLPENKDFDSHVLTFIDMENPKSGNESNYDTSFVHSGRYSFRMDSTMSFSPGFKIPFNELTRKDYAWLHATAYVYPIGDIIEHDGLLVITFSHRDQLYKYRGVNISEQEFNVKPNQWNKITMDYITPEVRSIHDTLETYFWYRGKANFYVDDLLIEVFEEKEE